LTGNPILFYKHLYLKNRWFRGTGGDDVTVRQVSNRQKNKRIPDHPLGITLSVGIFRRIIDKISGVAVHSGTWRIIMAKVLIVDDDIQTTTLFENLIKRNGHEPASVNSSTHAIQVARSVSPDLILLDIMMPVINGIELCKMLKADPELRHVPVIMVSALSDDGTKRDSYNAGAQDFLTKLLLPGALEEKIRSVLG